MHNTHWYQYPVGEDNGAAVSQALFAWLEPLEREQSYVHDSNMRFARLYTGGYLPVGLSIKDGNKGATKRSPSYASKNLVRSICDTAQSLVARLRPKSTIVTDGADWNLQKQAKDLDMLLFANYEHGRLWDIAQRAFLDSTVFGTGAWKLIPPDKTDYVRYEKTNIDEIVVDEYECQSGLMPASLAQRKFVRKEELHHMFPDQSGAIDMQCGKGNYSTWPGTNSLLDHKVLVEAWYIQGDTRRHVIAIDGLTLLYEEWPYTFFPFQFVWWHQPLSGFYGSGVCEHQEGRQKRVNQLYKHIQKGHELLVVPRVWVAPGQTIKPVFDTQIGGIFPMPGGQPPVFQTAQAFPGEIYMWLDGLERGAYDEEGISQVTASNRLPPGIESAPAQREYTFKEGQRFAPVSQRYETAIAVETAYMTLDMLRAKKKSKGKKSGAKIMRGGLLHQIDWSVVNMDEMRYVIHAEASSLESLSPASRMQGAIEMVQAGFIGPDEARSLTAHPDLKRSDDLGTAMYETASRLLSELLEGEFPSLDPDLHDLVVIDKVVRSGINHAMNRGLGKHQHPEDMKIIDNVKTWLRQIDQILQQQEQDAMQVAMAEQQMQQPQQPVPGLSNAAAQGLDVPFSQGGQSSEGL